MRPHGHPERRELRHWHRALLRLLLFLLTGVICLLAAEAITRLVAPRPISYPWMDQGNAGVIPLPGVHGRHFVPGTYDTTFSFSSQRFRGGQTYGSEPGTGATRIVMLGSSATFGSGANDDESYPFQLQSMLQEQALQNGSKPGFEVINAGIPGTVVAEQALWYDDWVKHFHPQIVVLNVACAVDYVTGVFRMDENGRALPREPERLRESASSARAIRELAKRTPGYIFLSEHSELFNLVALKLGELFRHRRNAALAYDFAQQESSASANAEHNRALLLESAEVMWLSERVEDSGARLVVIVLPCRENVYPARSPQAEQIRREYAAVVTTLRAATTQARVPFADLGPELRSTAAHSSQPLFYDGRFETHPTPAGYRAIAQEVAEFLREAGVIPLSGGRLPGFPGPPRIATAE